MITIFSAPLRLPPIMLKNGGRPFGAVIVRHGEVIAEAVNTLHQSGDPTAHAELNAIRDVSLRLGNQVLRECVVYASGQPLPDVSERDVFNRRARSLFRQQQSGWRALQSLYRRYLPAIAAAIGKPITPHSPLPTTRRGWPCISAGRIKRNEPDTTQKR